jgi:hypothetical protein
MPTVRGSCLCGDVAWETTGALDFMSHCHCGRCRKTHGTGFSTYVLCDAAAFRLVRGRERIARYESSPGFFRPFCDRCGAVVPDGEPWQGVVGVPAGPLDDDPGVRPVAHIFVASKAPWDVIADDLPRFDAYPPSFDAPVLADAPPSAPATGVPRGSCLCGRVAFVIEGPALRCQYCHCSRCRKARASAHGTNLFVAHDAVRFTHGEDALAEYKVPAARYYKQIFCPTCGSPMPRKDPDRNLAVVPMGSLDDDPGARPTRNIYVDSKAKWYDIPNDLPQYAELPPTA